MILFTKIWSSGNKDVYLVLSRKYRELIFCTNEHFLQCYKKSSFVSNESVTWIWPVRFLTTYKSQIDSCNAGKPVCNPFRANILIYFNSLNATTGFYIIVALASNELILCSILQHLQSNLETSRTSIVAHFVKIVTT